MKRRNCSFRAISPVPKVFSKDLYCRYVKTRGVWERVNRRNLFETVQYCRVVYSDASSEGYEGMRLVQLMAYLMGYGV